MCGGGGDGGASEYRRQESEREFKRADATRKINEIFGVTDPEVYAARDFGYGYALPTGSADTAAANRTARDAQYTSTGDDIAAYLRTQLDDYYDDAQIEAKNRLARAGLSGGQQDIDLKSKILETFNRGALDVRNQADASVAGLRSADEQARSNLINQINAGMDAQTAVSSAGIAMRNSTDLARTEGMTQTLANLFKQIDDMYKIGQYTQGQQAAYRYPGVGGTSGAVVTRPDQRYSGDIYR